MSDATGVNSIAGGEIDADAKKKTGKTMNSSPPRSGRRWRRKSQGAATRTSSTPRRERATFGPSEPFDGDCAKNRQLQRLAVFIVYSAPGGQTARSTFAQPRHAPR